MARILHMHVFRLDLDMGKAQEALDTCGGHVFVAQAARWSLRT